MNQLNMMSSKTTPGDEDLAEQALPGHGIPSQDPDPAAQIGLAPEEAQREAKSVLTGGGMVAGAATGAAVGALVAGPVGVVPGVAIGAVAGALGGAAASVATNPDERQGMDTSTAQSVHLHIEDSRGDGRPVVLIHGWPLSAKAWEPQVPVLLAAGYRVIAYDRRGFGRSEKPQTPCDYDVLAEDLKQVLDECELQNVTLVGFSMGGGEVARYIARYGESRLHSVVFAAAVPPYLLHTANNPEGPLQPAAALKSKKALEQDRNSFFDHFVTDFFSSGGVLQVSESQRAGAIALCHQSDPHAALECMDAFGTTDFREDLKQVKVPTLVIHGAADGIVPIAGSGERTHRAVPHSQMVRIVGAPHGMNVSHTQAFNEALLAFLLI
jgi:pimeloyl-ACP methyl ester carboxylesterase